jgi:outer membrane protein
MKRIFLVVLILTTITPFILNAQRVAFINSQTIRSKLPDAQQADQRIRSFVDEWKRELSVIQKNIESLEFEINKNRLIWTEEEKSQKEKELKDLKERSEGYARAKFSPNGEYDVVVKQIMTPIDQKISAAIQKVANSHHFDIVFDQSVQPLAYVNFKYDLTIAVLQELGVDVDELQKQLEEKIAKDPANQRKESTQPKRVSRNGTASPDQRQFENNQPQNPDTTKPTQSIPPKEVFPKK